MSCHSCNVALHRDRLLVSRQSITAKICLARRGRVNDLSGEIVVNLVKQAAHQRFFDFR